LADRILDWREPGFLRRANGAKADDYAAAGIPYGPRGGRFQAVAELRLVMGMTEALFDRIAPALTVYSEAGTVDPNVAPAPVLRALAGYDEPGIARLLRARDPSAAASTPSDLITASLRAPVRLGHAFTITAEAGEADRVRVRKLAVVRLTGYARAPLWVYRWQSAR
jgi:general secretion pathway protein K